MAATMSDQQTNPLVAALPPQSDYLTYLTIVESHLDKTQLNLLHELLQDVKLTTNIGWDLVRPLLPLLPESNVCLHDIAFLGNPRETVLKISELLESLGQSEGSEAGDAYEDESDEHDDEENEDKDPERGNAAQAAELKPVDMLCVKFHELLHMLCILFPRIKTKKPSRFLIESLKAVVKAFRSLQEEPSSSPERLQSCTRSILMIIKSLSGSTRPHLPPRRSQSAIPTVATREAAADPEGGQETIEPGEADLQKQILQSFVTQVLEVYLRSLQPIESLDSALAWSTRYYEHTYPVPGKRRFMQINDVEEEIERAEATISQLLVFILSLTLVPTDVEQSSAQTHLQISWDAVLHCLLDEANTDENHKSIFTIPDFPASKSGSLYALGAKAATSLLNDRPISFGISVFPEHSLLTELLVDDLVSDVDCDALIILGRAALKSNGIGDWETRAEFNQYLQRLSQMAASSGLSNVATQASELTASVLHLHPSSDARFDFILDTLKDCPYAEFKEAAVFWLRDEITTAFQLPKVSTQEAPKDDERNRANFGEMSNVFTHSETLKSAAPLLFAKPEAQGAHGMSPGTQAKFWLAVLNLYYLLCASETLYQTLDIHDLALDLKVEQEFIGTLEKMVTDSQGSSSVPSGEGYGPYMPLIDDALQRLRALGKKDETQPAA